MNNNNVEKYLENIICQIHRSILFSICFLRYCHKYWITTNHYVYHVSHITLNANKYFLSSVSRSFKIFIEILSGSTIFLNLTVFRGHSVSSVVIVDFIPLFLPPIFGLKSSNYSPRYSLQFFYFSCSCKIILSFLFTW